MDNILTIKGLKKYFPIKSESLFGKVRWNKALENIDLELARGEALGIVGESGSGKTTLGKCILGLHDNTAGEIKFYGENFSAQKFSVVFQDPFSSLNPRMTIFDIVKEPLEISKEEFKKLDVRATILKTLLKVGLSEEQMFRYPHEFSGGQRQRIAIARAIVSNPDLIIFDEPTSGLDVSVQAQILNILKEMKIEQDFSYIFISHNLGVIRYICTRIAVMYRGRIVEIARKDSLFDQPLHPYTKKLLAAVPDIGKYRDSVTNIQEKKAESLAALSDAERCIFYKECPIRKEICSKEVPSRTVHKDNHCVYCWEYN